MRPIVPRHKHCTTTFSSARQFKNHVELFSTFVDESRDSKMQNFKKKTDKKKPLNTISIVYFLVSPLVYRTSSTYLIWVFSSDKHLGLIVFLRG